MSEALATYQKPSLADAIEKVLVNGDLKPLTTEQRVDYYNSLCNSLGLNPLTKPFDYITLNSKLTLYARKDATDQLRRIYGVSIRIVNRQIIEGVHIVTAQGSFADGRCDESTGAVNIKGLSGENLANAFMKAETKAKRRVTLSICGLGMLDEAEVDSIRGAKRVIVNSETGEIEGEYSGGMTATPDEIRRAQGQASREVLSDVPDTVDGDDIEGAIQYRTDEILQEKGKVRKINDSERKHYFAVASQHGWTDDEQHLLLSKLYKSRADITTEHYDKILLWLTDATLHEKTRQALATTDPKTKSFKDNLELDPLGIGEDRVIGAEDMEEDDSIAEMAQVAA